MASVMCAMATEDTALERAVPGAGMRAPLYFQRKPFGCWSSFLPALLLCHHVAVGLPKASPLLFITNSVYVFFHDFPPKGLKEKLGVICGPRTVD